MAVNKKQCSVMVAPPGMWGSFQQHKCKKTAIVTRDGKVYCKIHDPEYIEQKDEERRLKRAATGCQKCHRDLKRWWGYCPHCGTKVK